MRIACGATTAPPTPRADEATALRLATRTAWAKSPDLKDPYVLPDAGAVDALVDRWRGPGA